MNYFTSDLHIGHINISKYRNIFKSSQEHDNYIINKILSLKKRDILYILGDFIFDSANYKNYIERISKKKCRIKLLMGNHDSLMLYNENIFELQLPLYVYKKFWLSHCPIITQEIRGRKGNIHGHLHKEIISDKRYFNVNIDVNNYEFVDFEKIKEIYK